MSLVHDEWGDTPRIEKSCLINRSFIGPNRLNYRRLPICLKAGEGRVIIEGGQQIAVCRDWAHHLHSVSAVCPHLGCQVHWNRAEASWDCPCQGSRFSARGEVLNGPALTDLKPISLEDYHLRTGWKKRRKRRAA